MNQSDILKKHGFAIERKLGQGGFGEVFLVKHEISQQFYAVKSLRNQRKENPEDILREIKAIAALKHPNIINYQHSFIEDNELFMVMEYCQNGSLAELISVKKKLNIDEAVDVFRKLSQALYFIHQSGFVHHDIKPSNILFDANNEVKLSDFGTVNTRIGTLVYSPPEMFSPNAPKHDVRTDIYSLGLSMLECLLGFLPIKRKDALHIKSIIRKVGLPIHDFPYWLQQFILKACHYNPEMRFQSMLEFNEALEKRFIPKIISYARIQKEKEANLLKIHVSFKRWKSARQVIENSKSQHIKFQISKAKYFLSIHQISEAQKLYEEIIKKDPRAPIEKELAEIYLQKNEPSKAATLLQSYLLYNFENKEAHNQLLHSYFLSDQWELGLEQAGMLRNIYKDEIIFFNNALLFEILLGKDPRYKNIINSRNSFAEYNSYFLDKNHQIELDLLSKEKLKQKLLFHEFKFRNIHLNKNEIRIWYPENDEQIISNNGIISLGRTGNYGNTFNTSSSMQISRRHLVIINQKNNVWLYDMSKFGTKINGHKVIGKEFLLGRYEVELGDYKIVIISSADKLL